MVLRINPDAKDTRFFDKKAAADGEKYYTASKHFEGSMAQVAEWIKSHVAPALRVGVLPAEPAYQQASAVTVTKLFFGRSQSLRVARCSCVSCFVCLRVRW